MADLSIPTSSDLTPKTRTIPLWLWPHVLSLEAPIVALLWAMALGGLHEVRWLSGVMPGLTLCVWTIYLADRTLDTFGAKPEKLSVRHWLYRRFRIFLLGLVLPACGAALIWLGLWVVPGALMWECLALAMLVMLYLAVYAAADQRLLYMGLVGMVCLIALVLVNAMPLPPAFRTTLSVVIIGLLSLLVVQRTRNRLVVTVPKEIAGGLLFALGCTAWVRFVGTGAGFFDGILEILLLAGLFTCNLTGITAKEREDEVLQTSADNGHYGLLVGLGLLSAIGISAARLNRVPGRFELLGWAIMGGTVLLMLLHARRRHLSANAYRVLADLAVAAPTLVLFLGAASGSRAADCCVP